MNGGICDLGCVLKISPDVHPIVFSNGLSAL
jgi:hypothetical protein